MSTKYFFSKSRYINDLIFILTLQFSFYDFQSLDLIKFYPTWLLLNKVDNDFCKEAIYQPHKQSGLRL
ncbi:hypothetical protein BpHYR1_030019 [Brachionus plicatilis]|uniref:Uncharacterized protein n=1 Tax=Brachionus plicatilis TaxID=10195 RepID=A0A3M7QU56_BRAPC|nr:hypothetical protein BpHYR1_030019 [Brachionus plicatilis]